MARPSTIDQVLDLTQASAGRWFEAARWDPATGRSRRYPWGDDDPGPQHASLGQRHLRPAGAGAYPRGASPLGVHQLIGDVWEWTSSDFGGYPGFAAFPYAEYSLVFFGPDYKVLRGGSFGSDAVAVRGTFRNGTSRSGDRSSPDSAALATLHPGRSAEACVVTWPTSAHQ
jgi:formylglycine-generating enzyme required for sulfatase activity